jgi:hypothetical protein
MNFSIHDNLEEQYSQQSSETAGFSEQGNGAEGALCTE